MQHRYSQVKKVTLIGGLINIILAVVKVVFGFLGQSSALIADGIHSFSDLLTDGLVLLAAKFANQAADEEHPYGHARIETFASLLLAAFLIIVGFVIGRHGVVELLHHELAVKPDLFVIWIALFSVLINEIIYRYKLSVGKKVKSDLLIANALHSRSDAASSLVVLVGVIGSIAGYAYCDKIAAIVVALMIIKMGWQIAWNNVKELIDTGLAPEEIEQIKQVIMSEPGVNAVHELRTRRMAGRGLLDVHIIVDSHISVSEGHHIAEHVMWRLKKNIETLDDVIVHIDSENDEKYSSTSKLPMRHKLLPELRVIWQGLPGADQIITLHMHYLAGSIEVELVLPLEILTSKNSAEHLQQQYSEASKKILVISRVTLLYQV